MPALTSIAYPQFRIHLTIISERGDVQELERQEQS
jgi:hypothetical protein